MTLSDDATWILIGMTRVGETVEGVATRVMRGAEGENLLVFIVARVLPIVVAFFVFINK